jgi:hypothetical protein
MMPLWLESCRYNTEIDWVIISNDNIAQELPSNVILINKSFKQVKDQIQSCFSFPIKLDNAWGLCTFRPAYGDIFKELTAGYDFWGYCDLDVIFGNISRFVTPDILANYDKIMWLGHFSLYKNMERCNSAYRLKDQFGKHLYENAFSKSNVSCFDEVGINDIFFTHGLKVFKSSNFADFEHRSYLFKLLYHPEEHIKEQTRQIFSWNCGVLKRHYIADKNVIEKEYMYIHFCRRKMDIFLNTVSNKDSYCIVPNKFCSCPNIIDVEFVLKYTRRRFYWDYWRSRLTPGHIFRRLSALIFPSC